MRPPCHGRRRPAIHDFAGYKRQCLSTLSRTNWLHSRIPTRGEVRVSDLSRWCLTHYQALHDFAAPVATVIAAGVAVLVTWRLGLRQAKIARQQAETASDRLWYDLFDRRYVVYEAAKNLVEFTLTTHIVGPAEATRLQKLRVTLSEARFFFPEEICIFIRSLEDHYRHMGKLMARAKKVDDGDPEFAALGDEIASKLDELVELERSIPARFEGVLRFPQLSRAPQQSQWRLW